jgi:hypothetical protein
MSDEAEWFDIDVHIRREEDGQTRVCRDRAIRDGWRFQWGEGNYSCDCSRHGFFQHAAGNANSTGDTHCCGRTAYTVVKIVDADTGAVLIDGDPRS